LKDKECSGQPKKFEDTELQVLLDKNSVQTLEEPKHYGPFSI